LPPGKSDALYFDDAVPGLALRRTRWRKRAALLHAEVKLGRDPAGDKSKARVRAAADAILKNPRPVATGAQP
jgi:hypothetical protein